MRSSRTVFLLLSCITLLLIAITAGGATDGIGVIKYSFATLDAYWRTQVTAATPQSLTANMFTTTLQSATPMASTTPGPKKGGRGVVPPSQTPDGGVNPDQATVYFDWVVPSTPGLHADLLSRQLSLAMFVNKMDYYEADSVSALDGGSLSDFTTAKAQSDEQTNVLTLRTYSARIELFLIELIRYYEMQTIPEKCEKIKELQQLALQITNTKPAVLAIINRPPSIVPGAPLTLEQRFSDLQNVYENTVKPIFSTQIAQAQACAVSPVSTKDEDLASAASQLDGLLKSDLTATSDGSDPTKVTLQDTIGLINAVQSSIVALKKQLDQPAFDPKANELLTLQMGLTNAQSNFQLVKDDQMGAQSAVTNMLATVKPANIAGLTQLVGDAGALQNYPPLDAVQNSQAALATALTSYATALQSAAAAVPASLQPNNELAICATIQPATLVDLSKVTVDTTAIKACLTALDGIVTTAGKQSQFQQEMNAFALSLTQLSTLVLCQRQGIALNQCN